MKKGVDPAELPRDSYVYILVCERKEKRLKPFQLINFSTHKYTDYAG